MREAHAHIAAYGQSLSLPNLATCVSLAECLEKVREAAAEVNPGGWVRLIGARIEGWPERRWPTITELDRAAPHRPCVIMSFDHHAAAANGAAMRAAGLRPGQAGPAKGSVGVDDAGGFSGVLLEHAAYKAWESAPAPTRDQIREHVLSALQALRAMGYAEVHDLHSQEWLGPVLADLEVNGELPVERVLLYPNVANVVAILTKARWQSERVRLAGAKMFADGTLNNRTALVLEPYKEPLGGLTHGQAMVTPEDLVHALDLTGSLGPIQLAVHAIGDGAVRMVLDAWEKHRGRAGTRPPRLRIEHCELIDAADVPRFAQLGVICSVQPCHLLADVEVLTRQLPHRLHRVLPLRELIDSGCKPLGADGEGLLWFGSDVPIVRANPEDSIRAATARRREGTAQIDAIAWEQRITEAQAHACFGAS